MVTVKHRDSEEHLPRDVWKAASPMKELRFMLEPDVAVTSN